MQEPDYNCENCGRLILESEIPETSSGAIICNECLNDPHLNSTTGYCPVCGNETDKPKCDNCGYTS